MPFHFTWPVLAFFTSQIIIATMNLRWHRLADVLAGIVLAVSAVGLSVPVARWEARRRQRSGTVRRLVLPSTSRDELGPSVCEELLQHASVALSP